MAPRPLLDKLDKLLANPDLKESQLQVYSRLLRVNASVEERQFDLAKQQLAETRKWAEHAKQPLARAWTSAVGGDLYQALGQPQLALGNTSKHNSKPNPCRIPSSSACSRTRWSASIRKSRSHKSAAIRQRGGQLFSCPRQFLHAERRPDRARPSQPGSGQR